MCKTVPESLQFIQELEAKITVKDLVDILIFPSFPSLFALRNISPKIKIGAQNMHFAESGAYTGEVSPTMLEGLVDYILIGHSERRQIFGETDKDINKKLKAALSHGFSPILCVGETLDERESRAYTDKIKNQIINALTGLTLAEKSRIIFAYEPIWAIGTGKNATPEQAQEMHGFIKRLLKEEMEINSDMPILYGGSAKPENCKDLLIQNDIDGLLIGGASLKVNSFFDIIEQSYKLLIQ